MSDLSVKELIGDLDLFGDILQGFFRDWPGIYDILPYGTSQYLYHPLDLMSPFCRKFRSTEQGEQLCLKCDLEHAKLAADVGIPIHYVCHAGLIDIAAPVIVNNQCLATIFCGQRMSWGEANWKLAETIIPRYENELKTELYDLWYECTPMEDEALAEVKEQLTKLTKYLAHDWKMKLDLDGMRKELRFHIAENDAIQEAFSALSPAPSDEDEFWRLVSGLLTNVCQQFETHCGIVYTISPDKQGHSDPVIQAIDRSLPSSWLGVVDSDMLHLLDRVWQQHKYQLVALTTMPLGKADNDIRFGLGDNPMHLDTVALLPFELGKQSYGILALWLSKKRERENSLSIDKEMAILTRFAEQMSSAYNNTQLLGLQSVWIQDVVHELLIPMTGILGHTGVRRAEFTDFLQETEFSESCALNILKRMDDSYECIQGLVNDVEQVARRFSWEAEGDATDRPRNFVLDSNLAGTLIACARDKQGHAMGNGIKIHVADETIRPFNHKVRIDRPYFMRAMWNLLDNAVKYSAPDSKIVVTAYGEENSVVIRVKNKGFPVLTEDVERIFDRRVRSQVAEDNGIAGRGLGLAHAQNIVKQHQGHIRTFPSQPLPTHRQGELDDQYETIFEIVIPINIKQEGTDDYNTMD